MYEMDLIGACEGSTWELLQLVLERALEFSRLRSLQEGWLIALNDRFAKVRPALFVMERSLGGMEGISRCAMSASSGLFVATAVAISFRLVGIAVAMREVRG